MSIDSSLPLVALRNLLFELIDGPLDTGAWVLGRRDLGLADALQNVSAEIASQRPAIGRNTIVAHAGHVKFGLELLNLWAGGEENPFADADWEGSWRRQVVTEVEWKDLIAGLRTEAHAWITALKEPREWDEISFTGALASAAHLAYHLGAIRQLVVVLTSSDDRD